MKRLLLNFKLIWGSIKAKMVLLLGLQALVLLTLSQLGLYVAEKWTWFKQFSPNQLWVGGFLLAWLLLAVLVYVNASRIGTYLVGALLTLADRLSQDKIKLQNDNKKLGLTLQKEAFAQKLQASLYQIQRKALDQYASVVETNVNGVITYVNQKFLQLSGFKHDEILGQTHKLINSEFHDKKFFAKLWKTILSGEMWLGEIKNRAKNGSEYWVQSSIAPVLGIDGKPFKFVAISIDISASKKMDELKDEFISNVSHEIRTPLTLIKASISNLKDGIVGVVTPEQLKVLEICNRNSDRLGKIINDILDLSRLESKRSSIHLNRADVAYLLHENLSEYKNIAKENKLKLTVEIPANLPEAYFDFDMVLQVLNNLVNNALRFAKTSITIRAQTENDVIKISVIDDGVGIAIEQQHHLFEKFTQINRPQGGAGYKGTGLGLAICKEILNKHESKIWVESDLGKGAAFHFLLPSYQAKHLQLVG